MHKKINMITASNSSLPPSNYIRCELYPEINYYIGAQGKVEAPGWRNQQFGQLIPVPTNWQYLYVDADFKYSVKSTSTFYVELFGEFIEFNNGDTIESNSSVSDLYNELYNIAGGIKSIIVYLKPV